MASTHDAFGEHELTDYFIELNDIELGESQPHESTDNDVCKTPDEGEQEVAWLKDAGYGHLISQIQDAGEIDAETLAKETEALTDAQAAAVKKRVDTLNATFKKQKRQRRTDVRDVFNPDTQVQSLGPADAISGTEISVVKSSSTRVRPERRKTKRTPFLRHRGEYCMTGSASTVGDGIVSRGISMLYVHSTDDTVSLDDTISQQSYSDSTIYVARTADNHHITLVQGSPGSLQNPALPKLVAVEDNLGVTRVDDLSKRDLERIRPLGLIELTSLFDQEGITFIRQKAKGRYRETGLFGVPLSTLLEHDRKRIKHLNVPLIFQELIHYLTLHGLHEEGILRVPGAVNRVKSLRLELEASYKRNKLTLPLDLSAHDVASLLKQFLRELPVPLLTHEYLEAFAQVEKIREPRQRVEALNFLIIQLPDIHRHSLQMLLKFLYDVVSTESNKMTLSSVAMIMAPNLFLVTSSSRRQSNANPKSTATMVELSQAAEISSVVQLLIHYQDLLWRVPPFLISQIRYQYQSETTRIPDNRKFMKLLGRKGKSEMRKKTASVGELSSASKMIRVNAPQLSKFNATIQLDDALTASDILARFSSTPELARSRDSGTWESSSGDELDIANGKVLSTGVLPSLKGIHLYEVGGNIGERRLDLGTNIMSLYQVNPNAELVVRMQQS